MTLVNLFMIWFGAAGLVLHVIVVTTYVVYIDSKKYTDPPIPDFLEFFAKFWFLD